MVRHMKQASNMVLPPVIQVKPKNYSEDDYKYALCLRSAKRVLDVNGKRDLLVEFLSQYNELITVARARDSYEKDGKNIVAAICRILPDPKKKNPFKKYLAPHLASALARLIPPSQVLLSYLKKGNNAIQTHSQAASTPTSNTGVRRLLEKFEKHIDACKEIIDEREKNNSKIPKQPTLTPAQRQQVFDKTKVPSDPSLQICLFCRHPSTNLAAPDDILLAKIKIKNDIYKEVCKRWNRYVLRRDSGEAVEFPKHPTTGEVIKTQPKKPQHNGQIIMCMCAVSSCVQYKSDINSTCPIRCRNDEGEYFDLSSETGFCSCPICNCPCREAVYVNQYHRTGFVLNQQHPEQLKALGNNEEERVTIASMLVRELGSAIDKTIPQYQQELSSLRKNPTVDINVGNQQNPFNLLDEDTHDDVMYEMAHGFVKNVDRANISVDNIESFKKMSGIGSVVNLPSGDRYDTRLIGQNLKGQHATNNHLGETGQDDSTFHHPGMLNRLLPDNSYLQNNSNNENNFLRSSSLSSNNFNDNPICSSSSKKIIKKNIVSPLPKHKNGNDDEEITIIGTVNKPSKPTINNHSADNEDKFDTTFWDRAFKANQKLSKRKKGKKMSKKEIRVMKHARKVGKYMVAKNSLKRKRRDITLMSIDDEVSSLELRNAYVDTVYSGSELDESDTSDEETEKETEK